MEQQQGFKNIESDQDEIHIITSVSKKQPEIRPVEKSLFKADQTMEDIKLNIIGYDKQSFLKFETQIYKIQVRNLKDEFWIIKRRFSDVKWLFDTLTINHIGYILPFFPEGSMESYFSIKMGLNKQKKDESIQQRIQLILRFLKNIYAHPKLKYTEEAKVFINQNQNDFNVERKKLQSYSEQHQQLQTNSSNFLTLIEKGSNLISNYLGGRKNLRQISQADLQFQKYQQRVIEQSNMTSNLIKYIDQLAQLKKSQSQTTIVEADIDKIQIINTKINVARQPNKKFAQELMYTIEKPLNILNLWSLQIHNALKHRKNLIQFVFSLKQNIQDLSRIKKLERRVEKFENNFKESWRDWIMEFESQLGEIIKKYNHLWMSYSEGMRKIWK